MGYRHYHVSIFRSLMLTVAIGAAVAFLASPFMPASDLARAIDMAPTVIRSGFLFLVAIGFATMLFGFTRQVVLNRIGLLYQVMASSFSVDVAKRRQASRQASILTPFISTI